MSQPEITVAICSHNRPGDVAECLGALMPQIWPGMGIEVLVCDSASSPDVREAMAAAVAPWPSVKFFRNEVLGSAQARNALLARAGGKWLALLDDDAVPAPGWVAVALELAGRLGDEFGMVGGAAHPVMPKDPPAGAVTYLGRRWRQLLSTVEVEGDFDSTSQPKAVGANMWFRVAPLREIGGFPENLGRVGKLLLSGEEKAPMHMLIDRGWRIWYCDRLSIGHKIHGERLTRPWATRRAYWDGVSDRRIARMHGTRLAPGHSLVVALKLALLAPLYWVRSPRREFFLRFWYAVGWLRETVAPPGPVSPPPAAAQRSESRPWSPATGGDRRSA